MDDCYATGKVIQKAIKENLLVISPLPSVLMLLELELSEVIDSDLTSANS
jgi:hypothetical protein